MAECVKDCLNQDIGVSVETVENDIFVNIHLPDNKTIHLEICEYGDWFMNAYDGDVALKGKIGKINESNPPADALGKV